MMYLRKTVPSAIAMALMIQLVCFGATIRPNDDVTIRNGTNYNASSPFGLFVKGSGDVSYMEYTLGSIAATEAKLVLHNDDDGVASPWTIVIKGSEFSFDETTFNTTFAGSDWSQVGTIPGVMAIDFYEMDLTAWYNDNLGKTVSLFMSRDTQPGGSGPIFEDREGTKTGDALTYGPRIEVTLTNVVPIYPKPLPDADGQNVPADVIFQWTYSDEVDVEVDSYTIYMDTDASLVAEPNVPDQPMLIDGTGDATGILPAGASDPNATYSYSGIEIDTVYYWRIVANVREPNALNPEIYDVPMVVYSSVWSFSSITTGPAVDTGQSVITWLEAGQTIIEPDAAVTDETNDLNTILWSVVDQPADSTVDFSPDNAAETVITLDTVGAYLLKLWADDLVGNTDEDLVEIIVYADSCEAAKNSPDGYTAPQYDFNDDCKQDITDFAMFAQFWLQDNGMAEYLPYEKSQTTSVPVVSITWPADGETISGTEIVDPIGGGPINAVAYSVFDDTMTDGTGIAGVLFELIDSESNVVAQHNEGLVAYDWADLDTTQYPDGAYTLRATATGNTQPPYRSQDEITVNIDNLP